MKTLEKHGENTGERTINMIYKNKILIELNKQGKSIKWLAERMKKSYSPIHDLATSEFIDFKQFGSVADVARILDVKIEDLFEVQDEN